MPVPIVFPSASVGAGVTRRVIRRDIADQIGEYALCTVSAQASPAAAVEPERWVFLTELESDGLDFARLDGFWLYVATGDQAGQVRRVLEGQYHGDVGALQVDRPFADVLADGTEVELTDSLPGGRIGTTKGINECINEGLARVLVEARLALTGNGTRSINLADYSGFLKAGDQINGLYDTLWFGSSSDEPYELSGHGARVQTDGGTLTLITDYTYGTDTSFQAAVIRPGHTLVYSGGAWGNSTVGLQADDHAAAVPLHWIRAFGCRQAIKHMIVLAQRDKRLDRDERRERVADLRAMLNPWIGAAFSIKMDEFPRPLAQPTPSLVGVTSDARDWP